MRSANRRRRGFTLIEALVAAVLVAVGVVGVLRGFAALTRAQTLVQERERMQSLAVQKFDEILAMGLANAPSSGDFSDWGENRYQWQMETETAGLEGLDSVRLIVASETAQVSLQKLIFTPTPSTDDEQTPGGAP